MAADLISRARALLRRCSLPEAQAAHAVAITMRRASTNEPHPSDVVLARSAACVEAARDVDALRTVIEQARGSRD